MRIYYDREYDTLKINLVRSYHDALMIDNFTEDGLVTGIHDTDGKLIAIEIQEASKVADVSHVLVDLGTDIKSDDEGGVVRRRL